jgi:uncharacterized DUF497 family protein
LGDTERLLSILECFAEDELFENHGVEIEQIEKLLIKQQEYLKVSEKVEKKYGKNRTAAVSAKKAVRMSIFTIYEEGDDHSSS